MLKIKIVVSAIIGIVILSSFDNGRSKTEQQQDIKNQNEVKGDKIKHTHRAKLPHKDSFRIEKDLLGEKYIPNNAYYGVQTLRALENFQISGVTTRDYPELVDAFVLVKLAAIRANSDDGAIPKDVLDAVEKACKEVLAGKYHDQF